MDATTQSTPAVVWEGPEPSLQEKLLVERPRYSDDHYYGPLYVTLGSQPSRECNFIARLLSHRIESRGRRVMITGIRSRGPLLPLVYFVVSPGYAPPDHAINLLSTHVAEDAKEVGYEVPNLSEFGFLIDKELSDAEVLERLQCKPPPTAPTGSRPAAGKGATTQANASPGVFENVEQENRVLQQEAASQEVLDGPPSATVCIYDVDAARTELENFPEASGKNAYRKSLLERMVERGGRRELPLAPAASKIEALQDRFPNFDETIDEIAGAAALAQLGSCEMVLPPLLLVGEPGVGKTYFSETLAKEMGLPFFLVRMENTSAGWVLNGGDEMWEGSRPGAIAEQMVNSKVANPLFLIDEIDKVKSERHDPLSPLFSLLERETAKTFRDECLRVTLDLSHATWILTANSTSTIPAPLVSRMTVINVKAPTEEQSRSIIRWIYNEFREKNAWGKNFVTTLDDSVIDKLRSLPPRNVRDALMRAFASAARRGASQLTTDDLKTAPTRSSMGFVLTPRRSD